MTNKEEMPLSTVSAYSFSNYSNTQLEECNDM